MPDEYIEKIRDSRKKITVLKTRVLSIRSGDKVNPIFIFEGKTDIGPYETWIKRIDDELLYKGLTGDGKAQVLEFRKSIESSTDSNFHSIYFFIDHDYDGDRGYGRSSNLFCTDSYSFENYLTTPEVLLSIINDELECSDAPLLSNIILNLFSKVSNEFSDAMMEVNQRLFTAAKLDIEKGRIESKISKFVEIKIDSVMKKHSKDELPILIPLKTEPAEEQSIEYKEKFNHIMNPMMNFRGKYIYKFFLDWIDFLARARKEGAHPFQTARAIKYSRATLSERSLASRSKIPNNLNDFIKTIKAA